MAVKPPALNGVSFKATASRAAARLARRRLPAALLALLLAAPAAAQTPPAAAAAVEASPEAITPPAPLAHPPPLPACPPRHARIRLAVVDHEPVLDTAADMAGLHALTGRPRQGNQRHLGLTTSRVEWHSELNAQFSRARLRRGEALCAVPSEVVLTLVQTEHVVRIASELTAVACLRAAVLAHERRHVVVNRETLRLAARRARQAAEAWAANAEGRGATLDEAMAGLQAGLRRAIEPSLAAMRAARETAHGAIDTPEEYRRLSRICPNDQRLLRERLHALNAD
jgi:hypothetical protein